MVACGVGVSFRRHQSPFHRHTRPQLDGGKVWRFSAYFNGLLGAGAAAVWLVDPKTKTVTIYGADRKAAILTSTDTLTGGDLLPCFSMPIASLFARL